MTVLFPVLDYAANPFLDANNDQPVSARFRGTEWGDDIGEKDIALTAQVVTTRIAETAWGAIFKIEFTDLKSSAPQKREIRPDYFIVTDNRIVLLNDEDNATAATKISAMDKPARIRIERYLRHHQRELRTPGGRVESNNQIESRPLHL